MTAAAFDFPMKARELENAGFSRKQAETAAKAMNTAASADRSELVNRGDLYRSLWIQGAGIIAILTALRFLPV